MNCLRLRKNLVLRVVVLNFVWNVIRGLGGNINDEKEKLQKEV